MASRPVVGSQLETFRHLNGTRELLRQKSCTTTLQAKSFRRANKIEFLLSLTEKQGAKANGPRMSLTPREHLADCSV